MKLIKSLLITLSILLFSSCILNISSDNVDLEKEDVLGYWEITKKSFKQMREQEPTDEIITSFQLNEDSTVDIYFDNSDESKLNQPWEWKGKMKLFKHTFGIGDVFVHLPNGGLGMLLYKETDGKICLTVFDYIFEKRMSDL